MKRPGLQSADALAGVVKLVDTADLMIEHQACESACVNPLKFGEPPGPWPEATPSQTRIGQV